MRRRYLRPSLALPEIYLYRAPIDFRKQANGLAQRLIAAQASPFLLRALTELEHPMQHAVTAQITLRALRSVANGAEGRFDRVGRAQALPVHGREIVEGQELVMISLQLAGRLWVFRLIRVNEQREGFLRCSSGLCLPDLV